MEYEIYWDDLKPEVQKELLELMVDNGNFDVAPVATVTIGISDRSQEEINTEIKM